MFDSKSFCNHLHSSDPDDHINALVDFSEYLKTISSFEITSRTFDSIIDLIENCIENAFTGHSTDIVISSALKAILILSTKISKDYLEILLDTFKLKPFDTNLKCIQTNYISMFIDMFSNLANCDIEKQKVCVDIMFNLYCEQLLREGLNENAMAIIELLTALIKSMGNLFNSEQKSTVLKNILVLISDKYYNIKNDVINIFLAWSKIANEEQINVVILNLLNNSAKIAYCILTSLIVEIPTRFDKHFNKLVNILYHKIQYLEYIYEEDEEDEEGLYNDMIMNAQSAILSFCSIIKNFPNQFKDTSDVYIELVFQFMFYDLNVYCYENENNDNNDFMIEEELSETMNDEQVNDESWKIRKAIYNLAEVLIDNYPDSFYDYLAINHESICNLVNDNDDGSKIASLSLLVKIIQKYGEKMDEKDILKCIDYFIIQINQETNLFLLGISYPYIKTIILNYKRIPYEKENLIINGLINKYDNKIINEVLNIVNSIILTQSAIENLLDSIYLLLSKILYDNEIISKTECLNTISLLFDSVKEKNNNSLEKLNQSLIKTASLNNIPEILMPITIYFIIHQHENSNLQTIINYFNSNEVFASYSLSSLILIALSPAKRELKNKDLKQKLSEYLKSNDKFIYYKALNLIYILLKNGLMVINELEPLLEPLLAHVELNDFMSQKFAIKSLEYFVRKQSEVQILTKIINVLQTDIPKQLVNNISDLLLIFEDLSSFVDQLFDIMFSSSKQKDKVINNIAFLFGKLVKKENLQHKIILKFETEILKTNSKFILISLQAIGEIGSNIIITSNKTLIDRILNLVDNDDIKISICAAQAIGFISSMSYVSKMYENVISNLSKLSIWLYSYVSYLSKIKLNDSKVIDNNINQIFKYFINQADYTKETSDEFVQFFYLLISIKKTYISEYFEYIKTNSKASPILIQSISLYLNDINDKEEAQQILNHLIIDPSNPISCSYIIKFFCNCINLISLEDKLVLIANCLEINGKHYIKKYYGSEECIEDIGKAMRYNSIDFILSYIKINPSPKNLGLVIKKAINAINDPQIDIQKKVFLFFNIIYKNEEFLNNINDMIPIFLKIDSKSETYNLMLQLIVNLNTYCVKTSGLELLNAKIANNPKYQEILNDTKYQSSIKTKQKSSNYSENIYKSLMNKYEVESMIS